MAGINDVLLKSLLGAREREYGRSPWINAAAGFAQAPIMTKDAPWYENILAGFAQGLGAGALSGYGQYKADKKVKDYEQAFQTAWDSSDRLQAFRDDPLLAEAVPDISSFTLYDKLAEEQRAEEQELKMAQLEQELDLRRSKQPQTFDIPGGYKEQRIYNRETGQYDPVPGTRVRRWAPTQGPARLSPEAQQIMGKLYAGEELTPEEQATRAAMPMDAQGLAARIAEQGRVENRFKQRREDWESERGLAGYRPLPTVNTIPTTSQKNRLTKIGEGTADLKQALRTLIKSGDEGGFYDILGADAQMKGALTAAIFNANRVRTNSGARLEGREAKMIEMLSPATMAENPLRYIRSQLTGRDQREFAEMMLKYVDLSHDVMVAETTGWVSRRRPIEEYPRDVLEKHGFGVSGMRGFEAPGERSFGELPPRRDGESIRAWEERTGQ